MAHNVRVRVVGVNVVPKSRVVIDGSVESISKLDASPHTVATIDPTMARHNDVSIVLENAKKSALNRKVKADVLVGNVDDCKVVA